ncbi:hypothetical protein CaCOL14_013120 [Colletotrichum acutatum]
MPMEPRESASPRTTPVHRHGVMSVSLVCSANVLQLIRPTPASKLLSPRSCFLSSLSSSKRHTHRHYQYHHHHKCQFAVDADKDRATA